MSSDARELGGVKLTIKAGLEHFRNRVVLVETMCYQAHILIVAVHMLGKVNVLADRLSRWKLDHTHIHLEPKVFEMIDRRYGLHLVDLFATRDNRLLDRYVSWRPDPSAVAVDAFLFPLKGENLTASPRWLAFPDCFRKCFVNK